jgi:YVTN family beta-propeller protein
MAHRTQPAHRAFVAVAAIIGCVAACAAGELRLEAVVPLGAVAGRIDHLAADIARQRLYVAELGNDTVGVVDVAKRSVVRTLGGFDEPQGVAYDPATDSVWVSNGGDGSVWRYAAATLEPMKRLELGADADNIRLDAATGRILIGFGHGLALVEPHGEAVRSFPLDGHPESLQLEPGSARVFVNVPRQHAVVEVDLRSRGERSLPIPVAGSNYPMALDAAGRLLLPLRHPANLLALSIATSKSSTTGVCDDADDVFVDARRARLYVSCGDGHIDVFEGSNAGYARIGHIVTAPGARTSLYVPAWDRLFLAVPASGTSPAAIWIMAPG